MRGQPASGWPQDRRGIPLQSSIGQESLRVTTAGWAYTSSNDRVVIYMMIVVQVSSKGKPWYAKFRVCSVVDILSG